MSVVISQYPENINLPLPVENPIQFSFLPTGVPEPFGNRPRVYVGFDDNTTAPDGTVFNLLGYDFTVDYSTVFSHNSFNVSIVSGFAKAWAFRQMILQSFYFREMDVELYADAGVHIVRITYPDIGVYDSTGVWSFNFEDFDPLPFLIVEPGSDSVFPSGLNIIYQLFHEQEEDKFVPSMEVQKVPPSLQVGTDIVLSTPVDFSNILSRFVFTTIPELSDNDFYDENMSRRFKIGYGSVYDSEDCGVNFGRWVFSPPYEVFNAGFQSIDFVGVDRHIYQKTNGYKIEFLTTMPQNHCICRDNYLWMWCYVNNQRTVVGSEYGYTAKFTFFENKVEIGTESKDVGEIGRNGFLVVGVGVKNALVTFPSNADAFCVELIKGRTSNEQQQRTTTPSADFATEPHYFKLGDGECCEWDIYFQSYKGGYDLLTGLDRAALDFETESTEICRDLPTGGSALASDFRLMETGKLQVGNKSFEKITLETRSYQKTDQHLEMFRSFKASESRYVIRTNKDGQTYRRKILIEAGSIRILERNQRIKVQFVAFWPDEFVNVSI